MVHSDDSERKKRKPRGRPFTSENNPRKSKDTFLDDTGHESGVERRIIATGSLEYIYDSEMSADDHKETEIKQSDEIDSIEFTNGQNVLKIVFKKQHNRSFRIQTFLNENTEIRPVTYTGSSTASSFWNLLKGSLIKE